MKKNKKLAILSIASGYGGAERSLELLVEQWKLESDLFCFVENYHHYKEMKKILGSDGKIYKMNDGRTLFSIIKNLFVIIKVNELEHFDYWITNTNKSALYLTFIKILKQIPDNKMLVFLRDFQWKLKKVIFRVLSGITIAIPNIATIEYGNNKNFFSNYNILVTGNPVRITSTANNISALKQGKFILLLANIARWKGIILALQAYKKSGVYLNGIKLCIYGKIADNRYYDECLKYIQDNDLEDSVTISPFCTETDSLYRKCIMVLNTSISQYGGPETFGRTIIEAWSFSKPVLTFSVGGPKYLVINGKNGFCVKEGDTDTLAEKIRLLCYDREIAYKMGIDGYNKVMTEFKADVVSKRILNYIDNHIN